MLSKVKDWLSKWSSNVADLTEEAVVSAVDRGIAKALKRIEDLDANIVVTVKVEEKPVTTPKKPTRRTTKKK
jgi:hypothetical protein